MMRNRLKPLMLQLKSLLTLNHLPLKAMLPKLWMLPPLNPQKKAKNGTKTRNGTRTRRISMTSMARARTNTTSRALLMRQKSRKIRMKTKMARRIGTERMPMLMSRSRVKTIKTGKIIRMTSKIRTTKTMKTRTTKTGRTRNGRERLKNKASIKSKAKIKSKAILKNRARIKMENSNGTRIGNKTRTIKRAAGRLKITRKEATEKKNFDMPSSPIQFILNIFRISKC